MLKKKTYVPFFEELESRIVPVLGLDNPILPTPPGSFLDAVVRTDTTLKQGSGSLFQTGNGQGFGHHILTAAHVLVGEDPKVTFFLRRDVNDENSDLQIEIPIKYQRIHSGYVSKGDNEFFVERNDIAVLLLTDPELPAENRLLAPPFFISGPLSLYDPNAKDEVGKTIEIIGYGKTGTFDQGGIDGTGGIRRQGINRIDNNGSVLRDEVIRVYCDGPGTYFLYFDGKGSPFGITKTSTAEDVKKTLEFFDALRGNIRVGGQPGDQDGGGIWNISFGGKYSGQDFDNKRLTSKSKFLAVTKLIDGGNNNQPPPDQYFVMDFDYPTKPESNVFSYLYGIESPSVGKNESFVAEGDSGGPWLIDKQIAAISSAAHEVSFVKGLLKESYVGYGTNVRTTFPDFLDFMFMNPNQDPSYHLVFDMKYQIYGNDDLRNDKSVYDDIVITAKNVDGNLQIHVLNKSDPDNIYSNKVYYSAPANKIKTLTIRGNNDNETFVIEGDLGLIEKKIFLEGRGGNDVFQIGSADGGIPSSVTIYGGSGNDLVEIFGTQINFETKVFGGPGDDTVVIGNNIHGIAKIFSDVFIDGGPAVTVDNDSLIVNDAFFSGDGDTYTLTQGVVSRTNVLGKIVYDFIEKLEILAGKGNDIIDVKSTYAIPGIKHQVIINAGEGNDLINIGENNDYIDILDPISVIGNSGNDMLRLSFSQSSKTTYSISSDKVEWSFGRLVEYKEIERIEVNAGSENDTINIKSTANFVSEGYFFRTGSGKDNITIGTLGEGLKNHGAKIFLNGEADFDEMVIDDRANLLGGAYALGPDISSITMNWDGQIKPLEKMEIYHKGIEKITLKTGDGVDEISVKATHSNVTKGTFIESGGGGDKIYIGDENGPGLDNIKTFVEIDTQDKVNKSILTIDDKGSTANHAYELDQKTGLTRDGNKLIRFKNVLATTANLLLAANKDLPPNGLQIIRWLAGSSLNVAGGEGQDIIALSAKASTLDDIQGQITLEGGDNQDQLYIIDGEYKGGDNYSIIGNTFGAAKRANLELKFNGFEDLTLITGHGKDIINLEKFSPSVHLTLDGRDQFDTVNIISGEVLEPVFHNIERINLLGGKLTLNQPPDPIRDFAQSGGILTGSATLTVTKNLTWTGGTMSGSGTTAFTPDSKNSKAGLVIEGSVTLQDRTLVNNGNATWNATIAGGNGTFQNYGTLSGQGSLAGHLANFGDFYPGGESAPGAVAIDGDFTHAGGSLQLDLSDYGSDSIAVSGTVTLGGALNLNPLTTLAGNVYVIIGNTGSASVVDIFAGQPEGTLVTLDDRVFYITYKYLGGPDGLKNDVALVFNQPPVLDTIGNKLTVLGCEVVFTATATDPDQEFQNLTFSLAGAPAGASIDPSSGEFYWQPTLSNAAAGNYSFTVRVTDDGHPNLYDEETITISVFDWFPYVDNYGSFAYVAGPSPAPLGLGSFRMGTGSEEGNKVFLGTAAYNGALLSSFSTFTYSAFVAASQVSNLAPYLNLYLDLNGDGLFDPANDNLLVYDPSLNALAVVKNLWQTHNAGAGFWYGFIPNGKIAGVQTLAQIAATYPSARVIAPWGSCTPGTVIVAGSSVGVGWTNFLAYVDKVTIEAGGTLRTFDFEPALVSIENLSKPEGNEGVTIFAFTVSIAQILPAPVGVSFNTTDGTATTLGNDYQMAVGTLVFEPGQTVQTITVLVNGDTDPEADETFFVKLLAMGNAVLINEQAQGTILNDDAILLASSMMAEGFVATRSSFGETQAALLDRQSSAVAGRQGITDERTRQQRWEAALDAVFSRWEEDFPGNSSAPYYGIKVRKESSENDFDVLWDLPVEVFQRWFPRPKK